MLTYALGRGVEYYDKRAVDRIVSEMAKDDFEFFRRGENRKFFLRDSSGFG